jgi:hypothetical protein
VNSHDEAKARRIEALRPHMWRPGQSGNPGGRPRGVGAAARRELGGEAFVKALGEIWRGEAGPRLASAKHRLEAAKILAQIAYGAAQPDVPPAEARRVAVAARAEVDAIRAGPLPDDNRREAPEGAERGG